MRTQDGAGRIAAVARRDEDTLDRLVAVWESGVRVTHGFLSPGDIEEIRPEVRKRLSAIPQLYCHTDPGGAVTGFVGVEGDKVEMLFLDAAARGRGIGRLLLEYAVEELHARRLDVNEENTGGVRFYLHMGFRVAGRTACDEQGRPFPMLHMELAPAAPSSGA